MTTAKTAPGSELAGLGVVMVMPTYGPVDPSCARSVRLAVMRAANRGCKWHGDASPDRLGYGPARNTGVQFTLDNQPEADGIMWIDSDIKPPVNAIARLLYTAKEDQLDFLSGVYHQRSPIHNPVFYNYNEKLKLFQPADDYPADYVGPIPHGACGFGFVWTSLAMLRAMAAHESFDPAGGWFADRRDVGGFGEDMEFCDLAHRAGYTLYVDTGVQVEHAADPKFVGEADFRREKAKFVESGETPTKKGWGLR